MFQDIGVSKNLIDQYRTYCEKRKLEDIGKNKTIEIDIFILFNLFSVDFSVMVLSSNSWPFSAPPNFVLPPEVKYEYFKFSYLFNYSFSSNEHLIVLLISILNNIMDVN